MEWFFPIIGNTSSVFVGKHVITWTMNDPTFDYPQFTDPRTHEILGKRIIFLKAEKDLWKNEYRLTFDLQENPIPVLALVVGIMLLLGLTLTLLTFKSIERIVTVAPETAAFGVGVILVIALLFFSWKWKK